MSRIGVFFAGIILGAVGLYVSQNYHVVRAEDGMHMVPKMSSDFSDIYVDIRSFGMSDWDNHKSLAVAIVQAEKSYLLQDAAKSSFMQSVDGVLDILGRKRS
jgi:hypothetical protein